MSQMRKASLNDIPSKSTPSMVRMSVARAPAQGDRVVTHHLDLPSGVSHRTVTDVDDWAIPVMRCDHRTSMSGWQTIVSSSTSSVRAWEMLTNGGNGERPGSLSSTTKSSSLP